jgi:hypothetical protein
MNNTPTPETDAFFFRIDIDWDMEVEFARKLERERDEAKAEWYSLQDAFEDSCDKIEKLERERDEAREALDCLLAVIGLTPITGNREALQEVVDQGLVVLRKLKDTK